MDRSVDASTKVHLVNIHGWRGYNNPWMLEEETDSEYSYINLLANPERYTGYKVMAGLSCCWVGLLVCRCVTISWLASFGLSRDGCDTVSHTL